jgi:hypothetical protein
MSAYDRLRDELWPTGTFGHALPPPREPEPPPQEPDEPPARPIEPWTTEEQDAHWAELCKEVGTPGARRPHLRLITDGPDTDAA